MIDVALGTIVVFSDIACPWAHASVYRLRASEALDRALRIALFADSRCVSMHHVIREVAEDTPGVDAAEVAAALADGRARHHLFEDLAVAQRETVQGSPHLFLADGTDVHNPGIKKHWHGQPGEGGFPVIEADEPDVYEQLLTAASPTGGA